MTYDHKTIGMAEPVVALVDLGDGVREGLSIFVVFKYEFLFIDSAGDMIDSAGVLNAQWTCHDQERIIGRYAMTRK